MYLTPLFAFFSSRHSHELEVGVLLLGDDVAAFDAGEFLEHAVLDFPAAADRVGARRRLAVGPPTLERRAVKE